MRKFIPLLLLGLFGVVVGLLVARLAAAVGAPVWLCMILQLFSSGYVGYWWGRNHPEILP